MAHTQLVKHVGVVHRDVADDDIGLQDQREHVGADVAGIHHLRRGATCEAAALQRGGDQSPLHELEVDGLAG